MACNIFTAEVCRICLQKRKGKKMEREMKRRNKKDWTVNKSNKEEFICMKK